MVDNSDFIPECTAILQTLHMRRPLMFGGGEVRGSCWFCRCHFILVVKTLHVMAPRLTSATLLFEADAAGNETWHRNYQTSDRSSCTMSNPPPIHMYCIKLAPVTIGWGRGRVTWCSLVFPQQRAVFPTQCSEFKLCSNATQLQSEALEVSQRHLCWFYKWLVNGFKSTKKEKPRNTFFSWIPDLILGLLCGYKKYQLKHLHWQCQTADHRSSLSV